MEPLDIRALKEASNSIVEPQQRSAGRTAVIFVLILNIIHLILGYFFSQHVDLPDYETAEELLQYLLDGHTDQMVHMLSYELVSFALSFLLTGVFSGYSLRLTQGQPANGRTLAGCIGLLLRCLLLFVLLLAAAFAMSIVLSLVMIVSPVLTALGVIALSIAALILFYVFRLVLFSIADRKNGNIFPALKDCARITKGHKKELFILDFSFLWFIILVTVISTVVSTLPDAVITVAAKTGHEAVKTWIETNYSIMYYAGSLLGLLVTLPLYYKFYTKIHVTFALAYEHLKKQPLPQEETQPLAFMEFSDTQE